MNVYAPQTVVKMRGCELVMKLTTTCLDSIPDQILELAKSRPDSIALSDGCRTLSYKGLSYRADRIAGYLMQLGVVSGDSVVVCMERSFDWIAAALGIMKLGAAYVPLDSTWPDSRLRFAVSDSGASAFIGPKELFDRLQIDARGVDPILDAGAISASRLSIFSPIHPDSLAYIVYTSGSTGVPKGVEITHANLHHLVQWHREAFGITGDDRASHLAGLGFDAAVWEIWPNLCSGATLCLANDSIRFSAELIQRWMVSERVTVGFVPTVYAGPMMAMKWPAETALRLMLTGGDTLQGVSNDPLPFKVVNNYGPAECAVVATSGTLKTGAEGLPSIGRPIAGARVYILDDDGNQVPDGTVGEIYIGGDGVGRGYRNLPDATRQAFMSDPFAFRPGARMYRSGDRAIRRLDGEIEFRGRLDRQIKIRGQRVELDEIGNTLARHPGIEFSVATARPLTEGAIQLIAYFLAKKNVSVPTAKELRAHLLKNLPDYMVPPIFVELEYLPLSTNGKIDLTKLPQPGNEHQLASEEAHSQTSGIELKLLSIVHELLGGRWVTVQDNLFLSGGHSLFGMQLLTRVRYAFGVDLTLQQLFGSPTVEELALLIETRHHEQNLAPISKDQRLPKHVNSIDNCAEPVSNGNRCADPQPPVASCLSGQCAIANFPTNPIAHQQMEPAERHAKSDFEHSSGVLALHTHGSRSRIFWVHNLVISLAKELGDDQPFITVMLTPTDLKSLGERPTLQSIAARLLAKIVATQPYGPYIIGGLCIGSVLAYEIACQLKAIGQEVELLVLVDAPTQPYLKSCNSITTKLGHPRHSLERLVRIGLWKTSVNIWKRLLKYIPFSIRLKFSKGDWDTAHEMIERAAFGHYPQPFEGEVLLLLSEHRASHLDFLPGWQSVVRGNLRIAYVDGHHREFVTPQNVGTIAEIITRHLPRTSGKDSTLTTVASSA
jgi:amino acid adenylation domain-containing protein